MTDREIKRAAEMLEQIKYHENEIAEHERRIALHRGRIVDIRGQIEGLKSGALTINDIGHVVQR